MDKFTTQYRVTLWGWMSELHQPKVSNHKSLEDAVKFADSIYPHLRPDIIRGLEATRIEMFDKLAHSSAGTMVTIQANIVRVE